MLDKVWIHNFGCCSMFLCTTRSIAKHVSLSWGLCWHWYVLPTLIIVFDFTGHFSTCLEHLENLHVLPMIPWLEVTISRLRLGSDESVYAPARQWLLLVAVMWPGFVPHLQALLQHKGVVGADLALEMGAAIETSAWLKAKVAWVDAKSSPDVQATKVAFFAQQLRLREQTVLAFEQRISLRLHGFTYSHILGKEPKDVAASIQEVDVIEPAMSRAAEAGTGSQAREGSCGWSRWHSAGSTQVRDFSYLTFLFSPGLDKWKSVQQLSLNVQAFNSCTECNVTHKVQGCRQQYQMNRLWP